MTAIKDSGKRKTVADIYYGKHQIENDLPVSDGHITIDRKARSRYSASVTIADPALMPRLYPEDKLSPFSTEMAIRTGLVYPNGAQELIPIGRYMVTEVTGALDQGLIPTVTLLDRAERVFEKSNANDFDFSGGSVFSSIAAAIAVDSTWAPIQIHPDLKDRVIAKAQFSNGTDRWDIISKMALSIEADVFFNRDGNAMLVPTQHCTPQTNSKNSVLTVEGTAQGTLIKAGKTISRTDVYNAVTVIGTATEKAAGATADPVVPFATVYDTDERSLTKWNGPFGKKLLRVTESSLKDRGACYAMAIAKLRQVTGLGRTVTFSAIGNPALDVGDIITVNWPDGTSEFAVIDSLSLPLLDGSMDGTTTGMTYV